MTANKVARGLLKAVLVILGALAGAGAGFLLGALYAETAMPNAGLEALGPPIVGTFLGFVVGVVVLAIVVFRMPRMRRVAAANMGGAALLLLVLGGIGGLLAAVADSRSSVLPLSAGTSVFVAVLLGLTLGASVLFGRDTDT
jgi:hypothetical protein